MRYKQQEQLFPIELLFVMKNLFPKNFSVFYFNFEKVQVFSWGIISPRSKTSIKKWIKKSKKLLNSLDSKLFNVKMEMWKLEK